MSWSDLKKPIVDILNANNYKELKFNRELEETTTSKADRVFTLRPEIPEVIPTTSDGRITQHYAMLRVMYSIKDNTSHDSKWDDFLDLLNELPQFSVGDNYPEYVMTDDKIYAIASIKLYLGSDVSQCG